MQQYRICFYRLFPFLFLLSSCRPAPTDSGSVIAPEYQAIAGQLQKIIQAEAADKGLPSVAIALVDDQELVYAEGFGFADADGQVTADMHSIYRIGSVSKLFTDIGIMQEVEKGNIDLDAPVTTYLPGFRPENPFGKAITLRQLMAHRAGLVREPPAGHYFDDTGVGLRATVESLNATRLVYEPGTRIKYSNAGIAVAGYVLEYMHQQPFAEYLQRAILAPLNMTSSAFASDDNIRDRLVEARMWTYDGRDFPAPTFELGMAPAGSMYASVYDLASFMKVLFRGGAMPDGGALLKKESLEAMWEPQFAENSAATGYGLGFAVGQLDGHRMVGHGGAIYGFSTEIMMLPEAKLGVVAVCSRDFTNAVMERIAQYALRAALAQKEGKALPEWPSTSPVGKELASRLAGTYRLGNAQVDLIARGNRLFQEGRTYKLELKRLAGDTLTVDGRLANGNRIFGLENGDLSFNGDTIFRSEPERPVQLPEGNKAYIGEYGWDYNTLYILERRGQLHVLIEWFPMYPITPADTDVFDFPDYGLYHGEQLAFERDGAGEITGVRAAGIFFKKRLTDIAHGKTFQITPLRPVDELRQAALAARPPEETGDFKAPDLVDLAALDPTIKYDIRYATDNNFMGTPFYRQPRAFMQRPAAEAAVRIHRKLKEKGYGLLIHDAYRPWYVTKMFWDATPEAFKHFVADPSKGSRHNRGCAVDLTLYDLVTGETLEMVGGYDEFSPRSYPDYPGGTQRQRYYRELLRESMEGDGFTVYEWEWWHFDFHDWRSYPILNRTFEELE